MKEGSERAPEIERMDEHAHIGLGQRTENRNKKATKSHINSQDERTRDKHNRNNIENIITTLYYHLSLGMEHKVIWCFTCAQIRTGRNH